MKNLILTLIAVLTWQLGHCQTNLIPNSSIEIPNLDSCPNSVSSADNQQLQKATPWYNPNEISTPDLFNKCVPANIGASVPENYVGYQYPKSGDGYAGFYVNRSDNAEEYLQVPLLTPLQPNTQYWLNFHLSLADSMWYATDDIGAYFSKEKIIRTYATDSIPWDTLDYTPQITNPEGNFLTDKINWMEVKGSFIATGGESFLTIGCFKPDIDLDTFFVGGGGNFQNGWPMTYYYIDCIKLSKNPNGCDSITNLKDVSIKKQLKINYNFTFNNVIIDFENQEIENTKIEIYNSYGELKEQKHSTENNIIINTENWNKGVYFIKIYNEKNSFLHKFLIY